MPIYVYRCRECEEEKEVMQKFSDEPLSDCEDCETSSSLEKIITNSSFVLKGDCWYKDGYTKSSD